MKKLMVFAAAVLMLLIGIANAVNPPEQKEGLWSIHRQSIDNPGNSKSESHQPSAEVMPMTNM